MNLYESKWFDEVAWAWKRANVFASSEEEAEHFISNNSDYYVGKAPYRSEGESSFQAELIESDVQFPYVMNYNEIKY